LNIKTTVLAISIAFLLAQPVPSAANSFEQKPIASRGLGQSYEQEKLPKPAKQTQDNLPDPIASKPAADTIAQSFSDNDADTTGSTFSVFYYANDGTEQAFIESGLKPGQTFNVMDAQLPTRTGYTFLGWDRNPSAAQPEFTESGLSELTIGNENALLYAIWANDNLSPSFTIIYDPNNGSGPVPESQTALQGASIPILFSPQPIRNGYKFLGWAPLENATTPSYSKNGETTMAVGDANTILYAVWAIEEDVIGDPPIKVLVTVAGKRPPKNSLFTLVMEGLTDSAPMPFGSVGNKKTISTAADKVVEFGNIVFHTPGIYAYNVYVYDNGKSGFSYDKSVYTFSYEVNDNMECFRTIVDSYSRIQPSLTGAMMFTNHYIATNSNSYQVGNRRYWGKNFSQQLLSRPKPVTSSLEIQLPFTLTEICMVLVPVCISRLIYYFRKLKKQGKDCGDTYLSRRN